MGFLEALAEHGYREGDGLEVVFHNAQGEMSTATTIAEKFIADNVDLIFTISTPSTQAAVAAARRAAEAPPVVFGAVTDPVSAGVVESTDHPVYCSGSSDVWDYKAQLGVLLRLDASVKSVGVVFNPGESNSRFAMKRIRDACEELGLKLATVSVSNSSEVYTAARSIIDRVDALYSGADNTIISAVESLVKVAEESAKPLIAGESDSVERGAIATLGTNYHEVGRAAGAIAVRALQGEEVGTIPVVQETRAHLYINTAAAERMGVELPAELLSEAKLVDDKANR